MEPAEFVFDSIENTIAAIKNGEFVVVMDDENRENEGDLIMAAEFVTPEKIAFMLRHTTGILCVSMEQARANHLDLPYMLATNTDPKKTAFTVSCDAEGTTTGVSAADRALTTLVLASPSTFAPMLRKPGHMFPLVSRPGGVLERRGHTEATRDLCMLAGVTKVGLLSEIQNKDGTMARLPECYALAKKHGLRITTVEALAAYRISQQKVEPPLLPLQEPSQKEFSLPPDEAGQQPSSSSYNGVTVDLLAECEMPISRGDKYLGMWSVRIYRSSDGLVRHTVLIKGAPAQWLSRGSADESPPAYVRVHSECFTSHVLGSQRCDCSAQLDMAMDMINTHGSGVAIYVDGHEGRGIGLHNKIKAYQLQDTRAMDTYQANEELRLPVDSRSYGASRAILNHLGITKVALLTNNPLKMYAFNDITAFVVPVLCTPHEHNKFYLSTKRQFEKQVTQQLSLAPSSVNPPEPVTPNQNNTPLELPRADVIAKLRVGIICTNWNRSLVWSLASHCKKVLLSSGVKADHVVAETWDVPGAFELPFAAQRLASSGSVDVVVCFGVLIKGETHHFECLSSSVSVGLMQAQLATNIPIVYGVLNCFTAEQAQQRCGETSALPASLAATALRMAAFNLETKKTVPDLASIRMQLSSPLASPCSQG